MDVDAEPLSGTRPAAGVSDRRPTPASRTCSSPGLRPDEHEPRDDGGCQRGRPARGRGILDATDRRPPTARPIYEPWLLSPLRWYDARRYARGLPWDPRPPIIVRIIHAITTAIGRLLIVLRVRVIRRG
jgi:hypothetical protein